MNEFNEVTYEGLLVNLLEGTSGTVIESQLKRLGGIDGEYTVYWPKDSIRVIVGADYGTARAVACILRESRTLWMAKPTTFAEPVIARRSRPLGLHATTAEVRSKTVYVEDKLLAGDIRVEGDVRAVKLAEFPLKPSRFDFATLPES